MVLICSTELAFIVSLANYLAKKLVTSTFIYLIIVKYGLSYLVYFIYHIKYDLK